MLNLIRLIWLVTMMVAFGVPMTVSAFPPVSTLFTNDGQNYAKIAYHGFSLNTLCLGLMLTVRNRGGSSCVG